ncbi:MAG: hypothetical protein CMI09_02520 [Oceanospirillaceae bacterium]|nr:hypothetical protein [Oceanospirillaceae bacterium]
MFQEPSQTSMTRRLLLMLAALMTLTPMAVDLTLPATPALAVTFGVAVHAAEMTVSYYLLGFGAGQCIGGPLSDRFGRRFMVLIGLILFVTGSAANLLSSSIESFWVARVVQALGAGLAVVNIGSVVRDLSQGREGAHYMVQVVQFMLFAPLFAPFIGMGLYQWLGWQSVYGVLLIYGVVVLVLCTVWFPETSAQRTPWRPFGNYIHVISEQRIWGYLATVGASYALLLGFTVSSPGILMGYFELSSAAFPFVFATIVLAMMVVSRIGIKALKRFSSNTLIWTTQAVHFSGVSMVLIYLHLFDQHSLWFFLPLMILVLSCHAVTIANCTSSMTEIFPTRSGTAMALSGAIGFGAGGLSGSLISALADETPRSMAMVVWFFVLGGILVRGYGAPKVRI